MFLANFPGIFNPQWSKCDGGPSTDEAPGCGARKKKTQGKRSCETLAGQSQLA